MGIIKIKKKYFPDMRNLYLSRFYGYPDRKVSRTIKMLLKANSFRK